MIKWVKNKFKSFFEYYFTKIIANQAELQNIQSQIMSSQTEISNLQSQIFNSQTEISNCQLEIKNNQYEIKTTQSQLLNQSEKISSFQNDIFDRIVVTENNLNYYNMIRSIMEENKFVNLELLLLKLQNNSANKILLVGFYGAYNLGDELMLQTVLSCIPPEKHSSITVMLCDNEGYNYSHLSGVNFIHYPKNYFDYNLLAQEFDALIWGGGAIIDDTDYSIRNGINLGDMFIDLSRRFIVFDKKVFALGLSSNKELTDKDYIKNLQFVSQNCSFFSVRDKYTQNLLNSLNVDNVILQNDLVFADDYWNTAEILSEPEESKKIIGIVWICLPETEETLKKIINKLILEFPDYKIKCIPFYDYNNTDQQFFHRVAKELNAEDVMYVCKYHNSLQGIVKEISETEFMVNMRYHCMLISGMIEKKSINVCYDIHKHYYNKVSYITEMFGIRDNLVFNSDLLKEDIEIAKVVAQPKIKREQLKSENEKVKDILSKCWEQ